MDALATWTDTGLRVAGRPLLKAPQPSAAYRVSTERLHLHCEPFEAELVAAGFEPGLIVFLSKHAAQSGRPSLTVHPVGNFAEARFGGEPGRTTPTLGAWQSHALHRLDLRRRENAYPAEVTFEVTHHGPLLSRPAFFMELGSTQAQWQDADGARVVAEAAWDLATTPPSVHPIVIGLGGGHYAPRFTEAALTRRVDFAHMVPAHAAEAVRDPTPVATELLRASPGAQGVYVHQGTLEGSVETRWLAAFEAAGVPRVESGDWAPAA